MSGTVSVSVTPADAPWTLRGPGTFSEAGTGDETFLLADAGLYGLSFGAAAGYITPAERTGVLADDGTLEFTVAYQESNEGGPENRAVNLLRVDLSELSDVQAFLEAADADEALAKIFISLLEEDEATLDASRPFILVHYGEGFEAQRSSQGSQNFFLYNGTIDLMFEADVPAELADDSQGAMTGFMESVGLCLDALLSLAGQGGRLPTTGIRRNGSPWRVKESKRKQRDFQHVDYTVEWGV